MPVRLPFEAFDAVDVSAQLGNLKPDADAFFGEHAFFGLVFLEKGFQLMPILF
jgi:hypothetical protein